MSLIKLVDVSKYYKSEETVSVGMKRINLEFALGEFIAVTGESGSGKSTLLNVISGLDGYEDGELYLFNEETSHYTISDWEKYRGAYVGFVFQSYNIIDSYTVYQNVLLALEVQGYDPKKRKARALELIDQVGLTSHKNHKASKLSGGQKQRTVIARALAKDCPIIVADEPTGNLDSASGEQIMHLLNEISKNKLVVVVTHDYDQVANYATRKIKMHDGEVVEDKKIKPYEKVDLVEPKRAKNLSFLTMLRFATRNLLSQPKKLIFLLLLQILVIGAFTITYSSRIAEVREAGLSQSDTFNNVPKTRLLIEKRDGSSFTNSELTSLRNHPNIERVYENSSLFYNSDYLYLSTESTYYGEYVSKTDTHHAIDDADIDGRRPTAINEIIFGGSYSDFELGDTVTLIISGSFTPVATFKIVGIDKLNRQTIYFSDSYLNQTIDPEDLIDYGKYIDISNSIASNIQIELNDEDYRLENSYNPNQVEDIFIEGEGERTVTQLSSLVITINYAIDNREYSTTVTLSNVTVSTPEEPYTWSNVAYLNRSNFNMIIDQQMEALRDEYTLSDKMVSVSVNGYYAGSRVIDTLDVETYRVYYPSYLASPMRDFLVFFQGLLAVVFLTLFGLFLYSIVHAVSRNVMNSRKKDFAIYRSIGTNKTTLARLVVLEQVMMSIIGFIIVLIVMRIVSEQLYFLRATLEYMELRDYFYLLFIFILFGAWLGLRFNRKVFNQSVIETLSQGKGE